MIGKGVDPAFYTRVVVEGVAVEVAEFKSIPLKGRALKRRGNASFHKNSPLKDNQVLGTLDKQHHVLIVNVLTNQYYLAFTMHFIEMRVKIAKI